MTYRYSILFLLLLTAIIGSGQVNQDFLPKFEKSQTTTHKIPQDQKFTFGYLEVPENNQFLVVKRSRFPSISLKVEIPIQHQIQSFTQWEVQVPLRCLLRSI